MNTTNITYPRILPVGDTAFTVEFGDQIDPALNRKVYALERALLENPIAGLIETVPSYRSLMVCFAPWLTDQPSVETQIRKVLFTLQEGGDLQRREIEIPVHYGGEDGPDLAFVAEQNGLTPEEVIAIHSGRTYLIYMMGFTPGFPYLGGMDTRIAAPRLETPRTLVPAGSVGIAGEQTGIYPIDSPGGWRIIGKTDTKLFDPTSQAPFLLSPGDYIRFVAVKDGEA